MTSTIVAAVLGGGISVFLGRLMRQVFDIDDARWISGFLAVLCLLLFAYPTFLEHSLEFAFNLPLTFNSSLREESTPTGKITFRDHFVRRHPGVVAEWRFLFLLNDPTPGRTAKISATFFDGERREKTTDFILESNSPPKFVQEIGSYNVVLFHYSEGTPVQIAALASVVSHGQTALLFHFGRLACLLLPLGALALCSAGLFRLFQRLRRFQGKFSRPFSADLAPEPETTYGGWLQLTRNESIALGIGTVLMIVFRLGWFVTPWVFTRDDVSRPWFYGKFQALELSVWLGRYSTVPFHWFFDWFTGCTMIGAQYFSAPLGFACLCLVGLYITRIWKVSDSILISVVVMLCLGYHPYMQELLTYRGAPFSYPNFLLVVLSMALVRPRLGSIVLWAFVFSFGAATYQTYANAAVTTLLFAVVFESLRELRKRKTPSFARILLATKVFERLAVMALGVVFFFFCRSLFWTVFPLEEFGYQQSYAETINSLPALQAKIDVLISEYLRVYFQNDLLVRLPMKLVLLALLVLVLAKIVLEGRGGTNHQAKKKRIFLVAILWGSVFLASVAGPFAAWLPVQWNLTPYRAFMFISAFWAGIFALVLHEWKTPKGLRTAILWMIGLVLSGFMIVCSQASYDIANIVLLDRSRAGRIIGDLEKHPDFSKVKRLCLLPIDDSGKGHDYTFPTQGVTGVFGNSYSSLEGWSTAETYNYLTGYKFETLWDFREKMHYADKYENIPVWPAPGSIVVDDETAIIRVK